MTTDLSTLSMEDLEELREQLEAEVTQMNNLQMAKKICLNSAYGALS